MSLQKENSCAFYASDYHLEMIMLPYINKNLKENKNIYVFTQNNLEETINTLLEKVNIEDKIKEKVLKINWSTEDKSKYKELAQGNKKSVIFVKGNENYIEKVNTNIEAIKGYQNIEIIDCFNLEEVQDKINNIIVNHKSILTTNAINS